MNQKPWRTVAHPILNVLNGTPQQSGFEIGIISALTVFLRTNHYFAKFYFNADCSRVLRRLGCRVWTEGIHPDNDLNSRGIFLEYSTAQAFASQDDQHQ